MIEKSKTLQVDVDTIRALIRHAVSEKGLSLNQIAKMSGLSVPTIARIYHAEHGTVHLRTASAIQKTLGSGLITEVIPSKGISKAQRKKIMNAVAKTLESELAKLV